MKPRINFLGCFIGAILGALPGVLIFAFISSRVGITTGCFGAFIGAMLALPEVSGERVSKMFLSMIVARNIPGSNDVYDWVDSESDEDEEPPVLSLWLLYWALAIGIKHRRGWLVLTFLVLGVIVGGALAANDIMAIHDGQKGIVLPFKHAKDSLYAQAGLLAILSGIWAASGISLLAAPAYRRPLLLALIPAVAFGGLLGFAVSTPQRPRTLDFIIMLSTFAAALALGFSAMCSAVDEEDLEGLGEDGSQQLDDST